MTEEEIVTDTDTAAFALPMQHPEHPQARAALYAAVLMPVAATPP